MLMSQRLGSLELNDDTTFNKKVGEIFPNHRTVFISDDDGRLLNHMEPGSPQPVKQRVLINFLQVTVAVENMNGVRNIPDHITYCSGFRIHGFSMIKSYREPKPANQWPRKNVEKNKEFHSTRAKRKDQGA